MILFKIVIYIAHKTLKLKITIPEIFLYVHHFERSTQLNVEKLGSKGKYSFLG